MKIYELKYIILKMFEKKFYFHITDKQIRQIITKVGLLQQGQNLNNKKNYEYN